jgi:beta-barrel assembly-enhancing protease
MSRLICCSAFLAILLMACGPQLQRPGVPREIVERERNQQWEMALRLQLERAEQVYRVSSLLKSQATDVCENQLEPVLGLFWIGPDSFHYNGKDVAARIFGLEEESLRIHSVLAGQPAAIAGLKPGDAILKIGNTQLSSYQSWYSLTKVEHAQHLIRKLGKNPIDMELRRGNDTLSVKVDPILACRYPVEIMADDRLNAFASGDKIMITTGMLRFVKNDDELALILGHEIAHNALNHIDKMRGIGTVAGVAGILLDIGMATAGMNTGGAINRAGVNAGRMVFSKEFEMESDYLGLYLAARAGFDVSNAPNFFRRMAVEHSGSIANNFLSSHPSSPERSVAMEDAVKEIRVKVNASEPLIPRRIESAVSESEPTKLKSGSIDTDY